MVLVLVTILAFPFSAKARPDITFVSIANDSLPKSVSHSVAQFFRHETFTKNPDRSFWSLQYGITVRRTDLFFKTMRYSMGTRTGYQFENELYHKLSASSYLYTDAAYAASTLLPHYRLRAEYFRNIKRFEVSGGGGIVKPHSFRAIPLITATFGYYAGNYFIFARPTFSYVDNGVTRSIFVQARRYLSKTDFVAISVLKGADTGTSRSANATANSFGSDTYLFRLAFQKKLQQWKFGVGIDHGGIYVRERSDYMRFVGIDVNLNYTF